VKKYFVVELNDAPFLAGHSSNTNAVTNTIIISDINRKKFEHAQIKVPVLQSLLVIKKMTPYVTIWTDICIISQIKTPPSFFVFIIQYIIIFANFI